MSFSAKNVYGSVPSTTRGKPLLVGADPKKQKVLYTCGQAVVMRDVKDPLKTEMYTEHQFATTVARYSPSGFYIASGDVAGTIRIWDTTQVEHVLKIELKMLSGPVLDLQWSDDSKRIVAVGDGKEKYGVVFMFDSGSSVGEISGHSKTLQSCDFKQTRPYRVATGGEDMQVGWFEGPPFKFKQAMKDHSRFVNCVRFSPDGNKLLTVGSDKAGFFYDGKTGELVGKLSQNNAHTAGIYACSWSADSKQVLTVSADKTAKIWNADSGEVVTTFNIFDNPQVEDQLLGCLWQGDEILVISLAGYIYYLDQGNPNKPKRVVHGHNKFITALAYDPSTNKLYSGSYDALIVAWDITTGATATVTGKGHSNQINKIYIQNNNLITASLDDTVRITPLNALTYGSDSIGLDSSPVDIAVSTKNNIVYAAITDAIVVIKDGKVANKHAVKFQPFSIALSPSENQLCVGGKDNSLRIYSISGTNLTEGASLAGHRGPVSAVAYSPDGQFIASADTNRDIFVWTTADNKQKVSGWQFHSARINSLAWASDSTHLVSGGLDGNIFVWDVAQPAKRIQIKDAHRGGVNNVLFVDAKTVASAGQDCTVKTWNVTFH